MSYVRIRGGGDCNILAQITIFGPLKINNNELIVKIYYILKDGQKQNYLYF